MKGSFIVPIFIIFLLSTTVVTLVYIWLDQIDKQGTSEGTRMAVIKSAFIGKVEIMNTGTGTIRPNDDLAFYVNDKRTYCRFFEDKLAPGINTTCFLVAPCGVGSLLVVAAPDNQHIYHC
jgi:hypothetical protein